jgi:4-amino-4-deoxychorismate lyase
MRFLETIRVESGEVSNLELHNIILNRTRESFFRDISPIDLREFIKNPPVEGLYRCRVIYSRDIESIEYIPYIPREFKSFKVVESNIDYLYKYVDRGELDNLRLTSGADEVIVEKDGYLTDTTIANIAFFDGKRWITPKNPLLRGTFREKMLLDGLLVEKNIRSDDIKHLLSFALMNAMIGFQLQNGITIDLTDKERIWF